MLSFTYTPSDGSANGAPVTVSITVQNTGIPDPGVINLDDLATGTGGFKIIGENSHDVAGYSVSAAGDVNNDGFGDLLVGAYGHYSDGGTQNGTAYVIFGSASLSGIIDLDDLATGTGGFKIIGEDTFDVAGTSVSAAGDVNNDGFDDLIVGAYAHASDGSFDNGAAYIIYGDDWLA